MKLAIPFAKREGSRARVESEAGSQTGPARAHKARRKRSRIARVSLLLVIAAATTGGLYLWQSNSSAKGAPQTIDVPVTTGDLSVTVESSGKAEATSSTSVDYETEGHV